MTMYRYEAWREEDYDGFLRFNYGVRVILREYPVRRTTPRGVWFYDPNAGKERWVSLHTEKAYAYDTKEKAMDSFKIRNARRITYLERDLKEAIAARDALNNPDLFQVIRKDGFET